MYFVKQLSEELFLLCRKPFVRGLSAFRCYQCGPCRRQSARLLRHRLILESFSHKFSSFVTLTYDEAHLPEGGVLRKEDYQKFIKRLRRRCSTRKFRYCVVGEYGDLSWRPHFHLFIYGLAGLETRLVQEVWRDSDQKSIGFVSLGEVNEATARYMSGYVTKRLTVPDNDRNREFRRQRGLLLGDRPPEFCHWSKRPGLGALALDKITEILTSDVGADLLLREGDVPVSLKHGGKSLPLGRYLRRVIREQYGFKETGTPKEVLEKWLQEMRQLHKEYAEEGYAPGGFRAFLSAKDSQKVLSQEARDKIFQQGKKL